MKNSVFGLALISMRQFFAVSMLLVCTLDISGRSMRWECAIERHMKYLRINAVQYCTSIQQELYGLKNFDKQTVQIERSVIHTT